MPQVLLRSMITRGSQQRPTPKTLPSHAFFSSLPISTLNFLDRSNFSTKSREEKISFMKGLTGVLDRFSEGLRTRKILPTLVEEVSNFYPHYTQLIRMYVDERCPSITIYPSQRLLYRKSAHPNPIRLTCSTEFKAPFHNQGPTAEYVDTPG